MGFARAEGIAPGKARAILRNIQQYYPIPPRLRLGIVSVLPDTSLALPRYCINVVNILSVVLIPSDELRSGGRYCPGQSPGNSKEHPTVLPDTTSASPRYCIITIQEFSLNYSFKMTLSIQTVSNLGWDF